MNFGQPSLFESKKPTPLAHQARPTHFECYRGQEHIVGKGADLRSQIENDTIQSMILWGPPGSGKTTLAQLVATSTKSIFIKLSAVQAGVKEIRQVVDEAQGQLHAAGKRTILFIDEIHRFNKSQQDALLPYVEDGTLILIGATTQNPSFEINSALLSRVHVYHLNEIDSHAMVEILGRAQTLGSSSYRLDQDALLEIAKLAQGDARRGIGLIEAVQKTLSELSKTKKFPLVLSKSVLEPVIALISIHGAVRYDRSGDDHYDIASALIKSIRSSDADAGLYYLARMIVGGEDPKFIVRRLIILASEDIGNADPRALQLAVATKDAVLFIGMPEARIPLAQLVTYLAKAPKSNASYVGINKALEEVKRSGPLPVPLHLRNAVTGLMKKEGYGSGYQYAHNYNGGKVDHAHLPKELENRKFYEPKSKI